MKTLIVPGVIATTQAELDEMLNKVKGKVERIMLDVMDGEFVPNTSLDFDFEVPSDSSFEYEAHLMTNKPLEWVKVNADKVDIAVMQVETLDNIGEAIDFAKKKGLKVTLALNPETELDAIIPYLNEVDGILILTVHPGSFCVEFLPEPIEKVKKLRETDKTGTLDIEVDGCQNPEHIKLAKEAGANIFASGSYIFKSEDVDKAIKELKEAAA